MQQVTITAAAIALAAFAAPAGAQSFNIDIGQPGAGPPPTYAAAGQAGHWISVPATQSVTVFNLVDVDGNVTAARLSQFGGTETLLVNDPALAGDDATLMNDFLITHTEIENCLFLDDMEPGQYEVIVYARMPAQPGVIALTNCDQEAGNPHYEVGGAWTGQHEPGVSHSIHLAEVVDAGPWAGKLWTHSGVLPGGDLGVGAALNGVQVRKIEPCLGDLDGSGAIDVTDLVDVILHWGICPPPCPHDLNDDGRVDVHDLVAVILAWGTCG